VLRGAAHTVITDMARQLHADLMVMGTVARSGILGFLIGNTAEAIITDQRISTCAMMCTQFHQFITTGHTTVMAISRKFHIA
jgi:hypothetical protein